jgi:hypothetical protein
MPTLGMRGASSKVVMPSPLPPEKAKAYLEELRRVIFGDGADVDDAPRPTAMPPDPPAEEQDAYLEIIARQAGVSTRVVMGWIGRGPLL